MYKYTVPKHVQGRFRIEIYNNKLDLGYTYNMCYNMIKYILFIFIVPGKTSDLYEYRIISEEKLNIGTLLSSSPRSRRRTRHRRGELVISDDR